MATPKVPEGNESVVAFQVWYANVNEVEAPAAPVVLSRAEVVLLARILHGYVGDLRMEISATDNPGMRRDLRHEEDQLNALMERLGPVLAIHN
jgi:hypothetical protein